MTDYRPPWKQSEYEDRNETEYLLTEEGNFVMLYMLFLTPSSIICSYIK